jgi:hypothetical protein
MTKEIYLHEIDIATHCETIRAVYHIASIDSDLNHADFIEILDAGSAKEDAILDKILDPIKSLPRPWEGTQK